MALMDLLTVGRSLSEARDRPHRFKLLSGALPKFGNAAPAGQENLQVGECASGAGPSDAEQQMGSDIMKSATIVEEQKRASASMHAFPAGRWTLNPFKAPLTPGPRPTVQGELSLDKLKPVCNDLNDSDLELVAVSKRPEPACQVANLETAEIPVVKAQPFWARVRTWFQARH